jgi:predicted secreted protein
LKRLIYIFVAGCIAALSSGCSYDGNNDPEVYTIKLTYADNGNFIEMSIDDEIRIDLPSNPSTGYRWENAISEGSFIIQIGNADFTID